MGRAFSSEEPEQQIRLVFTKHYGAIGLLTKWNNSGKKFAWEAFLLNCLWRKLVPY